MKHPTPADTPAYPLGLRKAIMVACAVPLITALVVILLHHKGLVDVEVIGLPERYLYLGGFAVILACAVPLAIVWRCPGCRAYLGRNASPASCPTCGARFR
jgi:hypothetical protein